MAERTEELQKKSPALPSAAQVIAYLRRHPDFLYRHPELLDIQAPPARHNNGSVVDLQHFMVERLRNDVAKLRAMKTDKNVLLLKANMGAGHGGASGRYDALRDMAFDYAFILTQLGISN